MTKLLRHLAIETVAISTPQAYSRNARTHSKRQVAQIAQSMTNFGWTVPILVDGNNTIIAGHGRLEAAKLLGLKQVPILRIEDLTEAQVRAYRLADNKTAANAAWDDDILKVELEALIEIDADFEITATGFEMGEIDFIIGDNEDAGQGDAVDEVDESDLGETPVSQRGDLWLLGDHRLLCGDALSAEDYRRLMKAEKAELAITDPPFNVKIGGHVSGLGRKKHREFVQASGEMSKPEFTRFLENAFTRMVAVSTPGALHYIFIDWRHIGEMLAAGEETYAELKNICVWDKGHGGMGSLYRSAHELVLVLKHGKAPHINNVALGAYGRNRSNIWRYPGANSFGAGRDQVLELHPTAKPIAMIADAILDASNRNGTVLDPFSGSGTILIAAARTGRHARAMELDPLYVDTAIRRFRRVTGVEAIHAETRRTFAECEAEIADRIAGEAQVRP